jgi:hypothetical protein
MKPKINWKILYCRFIAAIAPFANMAIVHT